MAEIRCVRVKVQRAENLAACDANGLSDPFVVLKYGSVKAKTVIKKKTLNPVWHETFLLGEAVIGQRIKVQCLDFDKYSAPDVIGVCEIELTTKDGTHEMWCKLAKKGKKEHRGRVLITLEFSDVHESKIVKKHKGLFNRTTSLSTSSIKRKGKAAADAAPARKKLQVLIGTPMSKLTKFLDDDNVPLFISLSLARLRALEATSVTGIFRISGSRPAIVALETDLECSPIDEWEGIIGKVEERHTLSGLVQDFLLKLPEPILLFKNFDVFVKIDEPSYKVSLEDIKAVVDDLPPANKATFGAIMKMAHEVQLRQKINSMDAQNLAICFAPSFLWAKPSDDMISILAYRLSLTAITSAVQRMLENFHEFYPEVTDAEQDEDESLPPLTVHTAQELFAIFDVDNSGFLDETEFSMFYKEVKKTKNETVTNDDILEALQAVDANGDGEISLAEFDAWWNPE
mmetsp:Transcript_2924/g.10254  ORF Transcript_2924/g.10254 Transcript_2924/m.10254 type:complete len:458 (+) Transcript_2924:40-1413(+)